MLGSGNPEIPCFRIHADTASIRACACEDGRSEPHQPLGSRRWHACTADWNAGDVTVLCEPILTVWPLTVGSGKFGTPCERMHPENATPDSVALAVDAEVPAPPVGSLSVPRILSPARRQEGCGGEQRARGRVSLLVWVLYGIRFFFVCVSGCAAGTRTRCRPREGRRLLVDRAREHEDHPFDVADHAAAGADGLEGPRSEGRGSRGRRARACTARPSETARASARRGGRRGGATDRQELWHFACAALNTGDEGSNPALA